MKKIISILIIAMSFILFTGCTGKTPNVAFNAAVNKDIKKVDIIVPNKIDHFTIFYYNHPGMNFGLIGALAAEAEFGMKEGSYNELVADQKFDTNSYFAEKLESELKSQGYEINLVTLERDQAELLNEYPASNADAYLDCIMEMTGYVAGGPNAAYKANATVQSRLVKASDKSIVYDKQIAVGENFGLTEDVEYLGSEEKYTYADFDNLKANTPKSIEGIKLGLDKIAKHIAESLKQ